MSQKWKENYYYFLKFFINQTGEEVRPSFNWFKKQVKERRQLRSNYDRYRCSICYLRKEATKFKHQHNKIDDNMMTVIDKNGLGNGKIISDMLNEEKNHLKTVKCITKVWKEIYDSLRIGTIIFFHDNSIAHE